MTGSRKGTGGSPSTRAGSRGSRSVRRPREGSAPIEGGLHHSRAGHIYDAVRDRVCMLRYPPGMVLRETRLAQEFGVSRTPVRQALQRLEYEGLVVTRNGVGTIVTGIDFEALRDVYDMRMRLLDLIPEMRPRTLTAKDVTVFKGLLRRARALCRRRDSDEYWRLAHIYHDAIGSLISNSALRAMYDLFYYQTARFWFHLLTHRWEQEVNGLCAEFEGALRAVGTADAAALCRVKRDHIALAMTRIEEFLQDQERAAGSAPRG